MIVNRIGTILAVPDQNSGFGRIIGEDGSSYTVEPADLPESASVGDDFAYKVDLWSHGSGLARELKPK